MDCSSLLTVYIVQIEQWGDQAKWKIDLVLLENADGSTPQPESPAPNIGPSSSVSARQMPNSPLTSENGPRPSSSQQPIPTAFSPAIKQSAFQPQYAPQYSMPPMQHGPPPTYRPPIIEPPYQSTADPNYPVCKFFSHSLHHTLTSQLTLDDIDETAIHSH